MADENVFLLYALLMGIFITFIYDILRIFRRVVPHRAFLVSLEDIGFWIYCATEVFLLLYHESNGILRWFAVLGALVGMTAYKKLISPFLVKYVSLLLKKLMRILGKFVRIIASPFLKIGGKVVERWRKGAALAAARASRRKKRVKWFMKKKLTYLLKVLKMVV